MITVRVRVRYIIIVIYLYNKNNSSVIHLVEIRTEKPECMHGFKTRGFVKLEI